MASGREDEARERRRRWVVARIVLRNLIASAIGVLFVVLYEAITFGHSFQSALREFFVNGNALPLLVTLIATFLTWYLTRSLWSWYLRPVGAPSSVDDGVIAQASLVPLLAALLTFLGWSVRGLVVGMEGGGSLSSAGVYHLLNNLMAGLLTSVLAYFGTEAIWQRELLLFFPLGRVKSRRFRLRVRTRLFLLFALGLISILYVALTTYQWAELLPGASNPAEMLHRLAQIEGLIVAAFVLMIAMLAVTLGILLVQGLEQIRMGLEAVRQGQLDVRIPILSDDEVGDLADGFNQMVKALQEQYKTRSLFNHYVSPEVATYALQHGVQRDGMMTTATILFSDIRNFTSLAEKLSPRDVMSLLNRYFQAMEEAIRAYGGVINKFIGDSLMAVFGTPLNPLPDRAEVAVWAALEMLRVLQLFNEDQRARHEPELRIGIGIATGEVVAGNVGGVERFEYTVIGNAVNVASRLESMTKEMKVPLLLDERTAMEVADAFPLRLLGELQVRGKQEPVTVYTIDLKPVLSYGEEG